MDENYVPAFIKSLHIKLRDTPVRITRQAVVILTLKTAACFSPGLKWKDLAVLGDCYF